MKNNFNLFLVFSLLISLSLSVFGQKQIGDTIFVNNIEYKVISENLIPNPGFEDGFTGWTDATAAANELSPSNFNLISSGGIGNSKYLVGTKNESSISAGSIGTGWAIESGKSYYFSYNIKYEGTTQGTGKETWIKVSLTNDKTNSSEPLILLDGANVTKGGQWTLNEVAFTNSDPSYTFIGARFRWLNNRLGFDNFNLQEVQELPNIQGLQASVDYANSILDPTANGASELQEAINTAESFLTSSSYLDVKNAISDLNQAVRAYLLINASTEHPLDMTEYIVNPSFDGNNNTGWNGMGVVNYNEVEFYQRTFDMNQQITGLPAGKYSLKAQGFERPKFNDSGSAYRAGTETIYAKLYAKSSSFVEKNIPFNSVYQHPYTGVGSMNGYVNTMEAASNIMVNQDNFQMTVSDILIGEGDTLIIGAKTNFQQGGYWVLFDNFRLLYEGNDLNDVINSVNELISSAQSLSLEKMQNSVVTELNTIISQAQQAVSADPLVANDLYTASASLIKIIEKANISIAAYNDLQDVIDAATTLYGDGSGNNADALQNKIDESQAVSDNLDSSLSEIYAARENLNNAMFTYKIANATGTVPTVITNPNFARGATAAFGRSTISGVSLSMLLEHGFCWSTNPEPTIHDNRTTKYFNNNGYIYHLQNLEPATVYYIRAYALTKNYAVGYGEPIKVITLPKGGITYYLTGSVTGAGENGIRIGNAMESAVGYWNNLTSIKDVHITVSHHPGTPTAEASYGGYMQFGANPSYQRTGTAIHEMGHVIGVGTHFLWYNTSDSPLRGNGQWLGDRANKVLRFLDNNSGATMLGDGTHMWPYGINGAHEDNGSEFLYIANSLITQGLGEDGLPPSGGFATPAYTFDHTDNVKYYLKSEDVNRGRNNSYLVENSFGNMIYREMTTSEVLSNDSAAWNLTFNPATGYYQIKNVATDKYFTFKYSGVNGIGLVKRNIPTVNEDFQLMEARVNTMVGLGTNSFTTRGYWIVKPQKVLNPPTFVAQPNGITAAYQFSLANEVSFQRWLILTEEGVNQFDAALASTPVERVSDSGIYTYSLKNQLVVENISMPSEISIYNISGGLVMKELTSAKSHTFNLPEGVYLVSITSLQYKDVVKVIVK